MHLEALETQKILSKFSLKPYRQTAGKKMGTNVWFHISCVELFHTYLINANLMLAKIDFIPNIVRIDTKSDRIAFINSPDFDISNEPFIKESALFENGELIKISRASSNPQIYHHKWLFVLPDYSGFDYKQSQERSIQWKSLLGVNKTLSSKIGRKKFWLQWLHENGLKE